MPVVDGLELVEGITTVDGFVVEEGFVDDALVTLDCSPKVELMAAAADDAIVGADALFARNGKIYWIFLFLIDLYFRVKSSRTFYKF